MNPIHSYDHAARMRREDFVRQYPHPFLVYAGGELHPVDPSKSDSHTVDRLVLEGPREALAKQFFVAELVPRVSPLRVEADRLITIGISQACDVILDDTSVSKQHAWFDRAGEIWRLWDNDSVAGTQVNNEPVRPGSPRELTSGALLSFGYVDLMFLGADGFHELVSGLLG